MESELSYDTWVGRTAYDTEGEKVGEIKDAYYDDVTGRPEWVEVKAGLFKGTRFVPLAGARIEEGKDDGRLIVNYSNEMIGAAPDMDTADDHLDPALDRAGKESSRGGRAASQVRRLAVAATSSKSSATRR